MPVYKWLKDGRDIGDFSPEHYHKITLVRREDAGTYQCIAKNAVGSVLSQKIDVTVACKYYVYKTPSHTRALLRMLRFKNIA